MKQTLVILLVGSILSSPALAADDVLNLECSAEGKIAHIIRFELTRATDKQKCTAIAIDATTMDISPVTYNSDWACEVTTLSDTDKFKEELIQMKVTKAVGLGGDGGKHLRFETLRLIVDTKSGDGAGLGTTLEGLQKRLRCNQDSPKLQRYFPKAE
jgi:hypothetical protein